MHFYNYHPAIKIDTWAQADEYINKGRNRGSHRKLSKKRTLIRKPVLYADDIVLELYVTEIVVFHRDGTFTIRHDGITTRTTIWDIQHHTPVRLAGVPGTSSGTGEKWCNEYQVVHCSDRLSPVKMQKCRTCHGEGEYVDRCHPGGHFFGRHGEKFYRYYDHCIDDAWEALPGAEWVTYRAPYSYEVRLDGVDPNAQIPVTVKRARRDRRFEPCRHGYLEQHIEFVFCQRCEGTGRLDYGSKPIHTLFDRPLRIDHTGRVMSEIEVWANTIAAIRETRQRADV